FQAIDLSRAKMSLKDTDIRRMIQAVASLHGAEPATAIPRPVPLAPQINRRTAIAVGSTAVLVSSSVAAWQMGFLTQAAAANRIAVLPFTNIGKDAKQTYLADGLCAEIRSILAQNGALEVIGQSSSESFANSKIDGIAIAKKLKADFLVDGAVQVEGGIIRITSELIEGKSGINRLPQSFEKPTRDILSVQREIAGAISAKLTNKIAAGNLTQVTLGGTADVRAFDHYLRGKDLYTHAKNEAEEREAVSQFEAAVAADAKFAAAHASKAKSLIAVAGQYGSASEIKQYLGAAQISARKAIALAPKLAVAHSTLALLLFQDLDIKAARAPFDRSRRLGEGDAPVMALFAYYCAATGRDREAVVAVDRALLLDPLNAQVHRIAGSVHFAARRFAETVGHIRQTLELSPNLPDAHARIGMVLLAQNKNSEALTEFERDTHKWSKLAGVAIAQYRLGNGRAAKAAMAELTNDTGTVSLFQQAQILAQWGQLDAAVAMLERARGQRDGGMTALRYDLMLDPLRKLPRFIRLLKSVGFD
ncbi:MAG: hypothetical protein KAZ17_02660, partial [Sphingorhabdus sp.]|nr:hypothetical protein [Sphingorhabdus sp.]